MSNIEPFDDVGGEGDEWEDASVKEERAKTKEKQAKKAILSNMGGSSALGKGFAKYAAHKFNVSQLGAIASAAQEYGSGGFTVSVRRKCPSFLFSVLFTALVRYAHVTGVLVWRS